MTDRLHIKNIPASVDVRDIDSMSVFMGNAIAASARVSANDAMLLMDEVHDMMRGVLVMLMSPNARTQLARFTREAELTPSTCAVLMAAMCCEPDFDLVGYLRRVIPTVETTPDDLIRLSAEAEEMRDAAELILEATAHSLDEVYMEIARDIISFFAFALCEYCGNDSPVLADAALDEVRRRAEAVVHEYLATVSV